MKIGVISDTHARANDKVPSAILKALVLGFHLLFPGWATLVRRRIRGSGSLLVPPSKTSPKWFFPGGVSALSCSRHCTF